MKKYLIAILAFVPILVYGQNDIQLTQQFLSRVNYNPAATGASEFMNAYLLARQQWVGFKNAPVTQVLNMHNYVDALGSGLGLTVINDKTGPTSAFNAKVGYAYHVHFDNESYLSLGLGAGILYKSIDMNKLVSETGRPEADPTLQTYINRFNGLNPDFDFGLEYNMKQWQVGASVTHLNLSPIKITNLQAGRHFYLYTKYTFEVERDWKIVPNAVWTVSSWPVAQYELNAITYYKSRFWFGPSVRVSDGFVLETVAGIVGLFITDYLRLGYSYDFNPGPLSGYSGGSHEIMLSLRLGKGESTYGRKTPRFFE